jgi:hypothetical protein
MALELYARERCLYGDKWLWANMGSKERVGVQRKLKDPTGCAFGGISRMDEGISPTLSPSRLGMDPTFTFSTVFGAEKMLPKLYSQTFIRWLETKRPWCWITWIPPAFLSIGIRVLQGLSRTGS